MSRPRVALAAVALAVAFALWLGLATVQSDTALTKVSNTGQPTSTTSSLGIDRAQPFQTGSNSGGYTLIGVTFPVVGSGSFTDTQLRIESVGTNSQPGGSLGTLTMSVSDGTATGTTPGIKLASNTEYFVVLESTIDAGLVYQLTNSDSEDPGAAAGWSIGDMSRWFDGTGSLDWTSESASAWKIAIQGFANTGFYTASIDSAQSDANSGASYVAVGAPQHGVPSVEAGRSVEETAKAALSKVLEVAEEELTHESTEEKVWSDSSLGCMQEGFAYALWETPGSEVRFKDREGGETPSVRVPIQGNHVVVCHKQTGR